MADVSLEVLKQLRESTGLSLNQCKTALAEAGGDIAKAKIILSKKGGEIAEKKSTRTLKAGTIASYLHANKQVAALVHLASESDFVAKNPEFTALAYDIAMQVAATNPSYTARKDVPEEAVSKVKETFAKEVEGKPEAMKEKIMQGKVDAYFKDKVLLDQAFIKDETVTIQGLIERATQKFGERIELIKTVRLATAE